MSETHNDFDGLMQRVREGSEDAVRELVERYGSHILLAVRRRLNRKLRSKFDSTDFVQAVWASFFAERDLGRFRGPEDIAAFLEAMARNKVIDEVRCRFQTRRYNIGREHSLEGSAAVDGNVLASPQPTPSQIVMAKEEWERRFQRQPEHYRRIVELRQRGRTQREIAQELGIHERTVRRVLEKFLPG